MRVSAFGVLCASLLLISLLAPCFADCPHSCSGHGSCHHDECRCDAGWGGDDCSVADDELVSGETYFGTLNTFSWHYYHINVPLGTNALELQVMQTSQYGDVDVYIQKGRFPTHRDYLTADDSTSNEIELEVLQPSPGMYYIGLYGYWHVDYSIRAEVNNGCTRDCGEHGVCEASECVCDTNWTGEECEIYDHVLTSGASVSDHVDNREWKYYHVIVPADSVFTVTLDGHSDGDVDLYLRLEDYPSFYTFDYLNGTIQPHSTLSLENPAPGTWYIGCYGYRADDYTLSVEVEHEGTCVAQCSGESHGTCRGSRCSCQNGFSGDYCESMDVAMQLDTMYSGHVDQNTWNYYNFNVRTTNDLVISIDQEEAHEDCDVFVKEGERPTRISYDYAELSYREQFDITIEDPSGTDFYVGVYGWTSCSYRISISIPITCQCATEEHGQCMTGSDVCICNPGWTGPHCDEESSMLQNGAVLRHEQVSQYEWAFYSIVADSSLMLISMKEEETRGFLWLYVSLSGFPGLDTYDRADKQTNTDFHEVHLLFDSKQRRRYYIGVYGNPFDVRGADPVPFSITAWSPPF